MELGSLYGVRFSKPVIMLEILNFGDVLILSGIDILKRSKLLYFPATVVFILVLHESFDFEA